MKIDLKNFFRYYKGDLDHHSEAVEKLEKAIASLSPSLLDDSSDWVQTYRNKPEPDPEELNIILPVPYYQQLDNYAQPHRTCNSSACAMILEYFKPGTLKGPKGDNEYLRKVFSVGESQDHDVQTKVLNDYGIKSEFVTNLSFDDLDLEIEAKRPVLLGILHLGSLSNPTGGHMIVVIGKNAKGQYICHDSYGDLYDGYTGPVMNGKSVIYERHVLERRWTVEGPGSGWGRDKNEKDEDEMAELGARADSLKRVLRNGGDFDDLVQRFSGDPGSKATGGVYDFFPKGRMVKPFEDFCFDKPIGSVGWVETTYGVHLIEVLDRRTEVEEARVAFISKPVAASAATARDAYAMASEFAINATDKESLMAAAKEAGYATAEANSIAPGARAIAGIRDAGEIVGWAYRSEPGEVSNPILTSDFYVVAHLDASKKDGVPALSDVEEEMREGAMNEAKGTLYASKMDGASLEEVAEAVGETVKTGRDLSVKFPTVRGSGASTEPMVAGAALSIPVGNMSSPIVGTHGVWVIAPQKVTPAGTKDSYLEEQSTLASRARTNFPFTVLNTMQKAAGVEDNRRQLN